MFKIFIHLYFLLTSVAFSEAISQENVAAFETPITWEIVYQRWHKEAVESHSSFCSSIQLNNVEGYLDYAKNMRLSMHLHG